jgi:hypothetical protein
LAEPQPSPLPPSWLPLYLLLLYLLPLYLLPRWLLPGLWLRCNGASSLCAQAAALRALSSLPSGRSGRAWPPSALLIRYISLSLCATRTFSDAAAATSAS